MIKAFVHVGLSVSSLERSIEFYCSGFGMQLVTKSEFEPQTENGRYSTILGCDRAKGRVALVRAGDLELELFEFSEPVPKRSDPNRPVCDHGITHFCVEVDDIEAQYDRLKASGASFHCPPLRFFRMFKATYGRDPDGNVFELLQRLESHEHG